MEGKEDGKDVPSVDVAGGEATDVDGGRDYNAEAIKQGWVPEEDWKGAAGAWRPAKDFVERGEKVIPILKDRMKKMEADLAMALKINADDRKKAVDEGYQAAKSKYKTDVKAIKAKKFKAVQDGNAEEYAKLDEELDDLEAPKEPEKPAAQAPPTNAEFDEWVKSNPWYGKDVDLTSYANFIGGELTKKNLDSGISMEAQEFYKNIKTRVQATFPGKFENPHRKEGGAVSGGGQAPAGGGGKSFSDMPNSAQSQFRRLEKQFKAKGRKLDKKAFTKTYFED